MALVTPFWFKQRQGVAETAGTELYKLTGPNLREGYVGILKGDNGQWAAFLRGSPDGEDLHNTGYVIDTAYNAWGAAFEIFRDYMII